MRRSRGRVAWVMLEVEPERQARLYVQLHMLEEVVHCDALDDEAHLFVLVREGRHALPARLVPDRILALPGVRRARSLGVLPMDRV